MRISAWQIVNISFSCLPLASHSACFEEAATHFRVPAQLLRAISRVESGGNPVALNRNRDGSVDVGHMQINSRWFANLAHLGISSDKLWEPCTNTYVGAWILSQNIQRMGYGWNAVGAYNAASESPRMRYAHKVAQVMYRETMR